ncbi:MAG: CRISPR-associated endonuclease Cas2 [Candidatus Doudnabacteria bacterium]|nr:CRISPR-associated endonuclease Cas2 [Candidatus Doudnabacteria bacterium]
MLIIDSKKITSGSKLILALLQADQMLGHSMSLLSVRNAVYPEYAAHIADKRLNSLLYKLHRKGWLKTEYKEAKKIIKLTSKGEMEALFKKARLPQETKTWDNKWRLITFDIPENARQIRDKLRKLLKQFGYKPLQASVYISPYAISEESVQYLNHTGLIRYIRIMRVDKIDNPGDLLKTFKLNVSKK